MMNPKTIKPADTFCKEVIENTPHDNGKTDPFGTDFILKQTAKQDTAPTADRHIDPIGDEDFILRQTGAKKEADAAASRDTDQTTYYVDSTAQQTLSDVTCERLGNDVETKRPTLWINAAAKMFASQK